MNSSEDITNLVRYIEELACHLNPGPVAVKVGSHLDENYILINKDNLPEISFGSLDDAYDGVGARLTYITEKAFGGDTDKMRTMALDYLAMADYIDGKKKLEEDTKLKTARFDAYKILFPNTDMTLDDFDYTHPGVSVSTRNGINAIIDLKAQLAEQAAKR